MRKYTAAPHPFVLRFQEQEASDPSSYSVDVVLFGHGQRYFPYIVHALQSAGQDGIGKHRHPFVLQKIDEIDFHGGPQTVYLDGILTPQRPADAPALPLMPEYIEITFHTPLRIKQDSKNIGANQFNFGGLFSTLLRRISMISYFHTDTPLETNFAELTAQAKTIGIDSQNLKWFDWTRYSTRQQTEMNMGGLVGTIELNMQGLEAFWPYLWLGQWTHIGKGTSMGMGAYSIATSLSK